MSGVLWRFVAYQGHGRFDSTSPLKCEVGEVKNEIGKIGSPADSINKEKWNGQADKSVS